MFYGMLEIASAPSRACKMSHNTLVVYVHNKSEIAWHQLGQRYLS